MKKLSIVEKQQIVDLYRSGKNCVEIKKLLNLKGHQQVLNVITKLPDYIPYKNGRNNKRRYMVNDNYFEEMNTEAKAYILGFICADGHVDITRGALRFLNKTSDKNILEKIRLEIGGEQKIVNLIRESPFSYGKRLFYHSRLEFCSRKLIKSLTKLGLTSTKTYSLNSSIISNIPRELIKDFLRGYFDGDGNVMWGRKYSSGIKYNINICGNLEFLNNTFNLYFPTHNKFYKDKYSKQCWTYKISSKERVFQFLKYIYQDSTIYLDRKFEIYMLACGHLKQGELLGTPTSTTEEDNQQPSLGSNSFEGSTTNSRVLIKDSNANTSALPSIIEVKI